MISSSSLSISNLPSTTITATATSSLSEPKPSSVSPQPSTTDTPSDPQPHRKIKASKQLALWSRARSIRSGRRLDRTAIQQKSPSPSPPPPDMMSSDSGAKSPIQIASENGVGYESDSGGSSGEEEAVAAGGKAIFMVSDGTGWTVEHSVNAALGQFEHCLVDRVCPVNTHLFSGIDDVERLMEIIKQAAKEGAMVVYTLADPSMANSAKQACEIWGIKSADILGPITDSIASHLGVSPLGLPRWAPGRSNSLSDEYFQRIEAIEFTIKQDDGALPQNLHKADIILAGVSRTGKTPLSIYLAQKGYKVANVPIVMNLELPQSLFEVESEKVFAMTINPVVLQTIRKARAKSLGFADQLKCSYSEMDHVKRELEFASKIFARNPLWPVIDVTGKAIEETAAIVLRLYHDRRNKCAMPRISKRY